MPSQPIALALAARPHAVVFGRPMRLTGVVSITRSSVASIFSSQKCTFLCSFFFSPWVDTGKIEKILQGCSSAGGLNDRMKKAQETLRCTEKQRVGGRNRFSNGCAVSSTDAKKKKSSRRRRKCDRSGWRVKTSGPAHNGRSFSFRTTVFWYVYGSMFQSLLRSFRFFAATCKTQPSCPRALRASFPRIPLYAVDLSKKQEHADIWHLTTGQERCTHLHAIVDRDFQPFMSDQETVSHPHQRSRRLAACSQCCAHVHSCLPYLLPEPACAHIALPVPVSHDMPNGHLILRVFPFSRFGAAGCQAQGPSTRAGM